MGKKLFALSLLVSAFGSFSVMAARPPVDSLNDLPFHWEGVVGDFLAQGPGTLNIDRVLRVRREEGLGGPSATYDVEARLGLGSRVISVNSIELRSSVESKGVYWLTLRLNDPLVPLLLASVTYDEATNTYSLKEMPRQGGERRFVFQAQASR